MASAWQEFSKGLGDAIADIREKVVEEPWFGRAVTDRESAASYESPLSGRWPESREAEPGAGSMTRETEKAPDMDLDR